MTSFGIFSKPGKEPTNSDRAQWARHALTVFTLEKYGGRTPDSMETDELATAVKDLITDLLHFASQEDMDAKALHSSAFEMFEAELLDER